jgi:chromate transporter
MPQPTGEIFGAFLRLGLTSFGGPIAHLEYFRREFVERRRWLDAERFGQLLAMAQFLPGPASSQLGFSIGLLRGGWRGALAAFTAFTLPSALLLAALAMLGATLDPNLEDPRWLALVQGLKLVAVVVVADGLWRMGRQLTPDLPRLTIAVIATSVVLGLGTASAQLVAIAAGAVLGAAILRPQPLHGGSGFALGYGPRASIVLLVLVAAGLGLALLPNAGGPSLGALAAAFWRAGALVFGGGHVVLPLLEASTVTTGWVTQDVFLAGYGAAQAIPGPMFAFAAYLGALTPSGAAPALGALLATLAVFAPGLLLISALLPLWGRLAAHPRALRAVTGVNAAVVGLLAAALWDPVITSGIADASDAAIAALALLIQRQLRRPTPWVLACCVLGALLLV